ncbi:hypothetical protein ACFQ1S_20950, partial [Kibdelosporangium lantanae]
VLLVVAGQGPELAHLRALTSHDDGIVYLTDVQDDEKPLLMNGCAAYALPTRPEPDFVETFGIALVEKMLAGGSGVVPTWSIPSAFLMPITSGHPRELGRATAASRWMSRGHQADGIDHEDHPLVQITTDQ